jgi:hypothetical protein
MSLFVITYWVEECQRRAACGGLGAWAGAHNVLVEADDFSEAVKHCVPGPDCYRVEIAPVHKKVSQQEGE